VLNRARTDHTLWAHSVTRSDADGPAIRLRVLEVLGELVTRCCLVDEAGAARTAEEDEATSGTVVFSTTLLPKKTKPPDILPGVTIEIWPPWTDVALGSVALPPGDDAVEPRRALVCSRYRIVQ